ncbi:GNAT family N-acetyltransferase [Nocardia lasii]|uniref:GNAT family N-acetyltransferase n=1 Tax=Nocardia lasii TaxID=1616107 RepID=A0ABW1JQ70_9NOCA
MIIEPLSIPRIAEVIALTNTGAPHLLPRTRSDYWAYATLFSTTCPVAMIDQRVVGSVIAFRSQDDPDDIYIQDVITHPDYRRRGITRTLIDTVAGRGVEWGCRRLYLTSEPDNVSAHAAWTALGFTNAAGDYEVGGISVITDYKGPGRSRAVYELPLDPA